jgi:hypothetical protein
MKKEDVRPAMESLDALTGAMIPIPRKVVDEEYKTFRHYYVYFTSNKVQHAFTDKCGYNRKISSSIRCGPQLMEGAGFVRY